jgi:hypothetical protein
MSPALALVWSLAAAGGPPSTGPHAAAPGTGMDSAIGVVQVARGATGPQPYLKRAPDGASLRLVGELTVELARLQSARVEVVGAAGSDHFVVSGYRIVALQGGARPLAVGRIVPTGGAGILGLDTDSGPPMTLSATSKLRIALSALLGAKVWVQGEHLLSGELRVDRYGVLRDPPPRESASPQPTTDPITK